jgi:CRISPR/Cas system-associated protein Cas7 (RAMP superfamily)
MTVSKEEIQEIIQLITENDFTPIVVASLTLLESYASLFVPSIEKLIDSQVKFTERSINAYQTAGFTREEAILLCLNSKVAMNEYLDKIGRNGK